MVGYGVVIPRNEIAGLNELTIGFGSTVFGACVAYVMRTSPAPSQNLFVVYTAVAPAAAVNDRILQGRI